MPERRGPHEQLSNVNRVFRDVFGFFFEVCFQPPAPVGSYRGQNAVGRFLALARRYGEFFGAKTAPPPPKSVREVCREAVWTVRNTPPPRVHAGGVVGGWWVAGGLVAGCWWLVAGWLVAGGCWLVAWG